jgi:hypothetical protein
MKYWLNSLLSNINLNKVMNNKSVKEQIEELKKEKLLEVLLGLYKKKQILGPKPNPLSKYRSVYITYLKYQKKYSHDVPSTKTL